MRYFEETKDNEAKKIEMGERELVTDTMLNEFLGGDNTNGEAWEMLLDILNEQYPREDAVSDIRDYCN